MIREIEEEEKLISRHYALKKSVVESKSVSQARWRFKQLAANEARIPEDCV